MRDDHHTADSEPDTTGRRPFLAAMGAGAAGALGTAGCVGDDQDDSGSVAAVEPPGEPVAPSGVSWDELGTLEGELTVYSGRTPDQIDLVFNRLEESYDRLTINRDYDDNATQVNQLLQEGDATPADVFYSQDPGALGAVAEEGLTQALPEDVVETVPGSYRHPDGLWSGVSGRVRSIQYNSERLPAETPFEGPADLPTDIYAYAEDDRFEGIISTRPNSGTFRGFVQAFVELEGESAARQWLEDFMNQDPQLFASGGDQAAAVNRGGNADPIVALGNSYYAARIVGENPDAPLRVTFTEDDPGCLFSVAGIAATRSTDNPELVAEFARHLVAIEGQEFMIEANGEFPVIDGVEYVGPLPGPDELNAPTFDLTSFDTELQDARTLIEDAGLLPL